MENASRNSTTTVSNSIVYTFWSASTLGVVVNSVFIIVVLLACRSLRRPANYALMLLSLGCLLFIMSTTLRVTGIYRSTNATLKYLHGLTCFCSFLGASRKFPQSLVSLATVSIIQDRKDYARNPMARPSPWKTLRRLLCITVFSIFISIPYGLEFYFDGEQQQCTKKDFLFESELLTTLYNFMFLIVVHLYPTAILVKEMWKSKEMLRSVFRCREGVPGLQEKRVQLALASCIFSLVYLICWPPMGVFHFLNDLPGDALSQNVRSSIHHWWKYTRILTFAYACANPTLLVVLCYDWKWTTLASLLTRITK